MRRPTIVQVASAAGVSRATAARVLSGATNVDPAMTAAVEVAAKDLGYETNAAARALRGGRTGAIGLVVAFSELDRVTGTFFAAVLKGAAKGLSVGEHQPVLLPADDPDVELVPRLLRSHAVDGAVVILQHEITHLVEMLATAPVPIAWVGRPQLGPTPGMIVVDSDNYGGGVLAARTLLAAGRRRLGIVAGPTDMEAACARTRGWNDELARHGLAPSPAVHSDFTLDGGAAAMARLLRRAPDLDGVFASSDLMGVGAMRVLQASGRQIPTDVAVIGYDDVLVASTSEPPLTTIRQPLVAMGRVAAETVIAAVRGEPYVDEHVLATTLVRRESL